MLGLSCREKRLTSFIFAICCWEKSIQIHDALLRSLISQRKILGFQARVEVLCAAAVWPKLYIPSTYYKHLKEAVSEPFGLVSVRQKYQLEKSSSMNWIFSPF